MQVLMRLNDNNYQEIATGTCVNCIGRCFPHITILTKHDPFAKAFALLRCCASSDVRMYVYCWFIDNPMPAQVGVVPPTARAFALIGKEDAIAQMYQSALTHCIAYESSDEPSSKRRDTGVKPPDMTVDTFFSALGASDQMRNDIKNYHMPALVQTLMQLTGRARYSEICAAEYRISPTKDITMPCNPDFPPPWLSGINDWQQLKQKYSSHYCGVYMPTTPIECALHPTIQMRPSGSASFELDFTHLLTPDFVRRVLCAAYHQIAIFVPQRTPEAYELLAREFREATAMHPPGHGTISMLNLVNDAATRLASDNSMHRGVTDGWFAEMRRLSVQSNALFRMFNYHLSHLLDYNTQLGALVGALVLPLSIAHTSELFRIAYTINGPFSAGKSTISQILTKFLPVTTNKQTETPMSSFYGTPLMGIPHVHILPETNMLVFRGESDGRNAVIAHVKEIATAGVAIHDCCFKNPATGQQEVVRRVVICARAVLIETSNDMMNGIDTGRTVILSLDGQTNSADTSRINLPSIVTAPSSEAMEARVACMQRLMANIMGVASSFYAVFPWHPDTALTAPLLTVMQTFRMTPRFTVLMRELIRAAQRLELLMQVFLDRTTRTEIGSDPYVLLYASLWPPQMSLAAELAQIPDQCQPYDCPDKHSLVYYGLACTADIFRMTERDYIPILVASVSKAFIVESVLPSVVRGTATALDVYQSGIKTKAFVIKHGQFFVRISACTLIEASAVDKATRIFQILAEMHASKLLAVTVDQAGVDLVVMDRHFVAWLNGADQRMYGEIAAHGSNQKCSKLATFMARLEQLRFPGAWLAMVQFGLDMYPDSTVHPSLVTFVETYKVATACVFISIEDLYPRWGDNNMVVIPLKSITQAAVVFNLPQIVRIIQTRVGIDVPFCLHTQMDGRVINVEANNSLHLRPRVLRIGTWVPSFYPVDTSHDMVDCNEPYPQLLIRMFLNSVVSNCPGMVVGMPTALYKYHPVAGTWNNQWVLSDNNTDDQAAARWPAYVMPDDRMCSVALAFCVLGRPDYPPVAAYIAAMVSRPAKAIRCLRKLATMSFTQVDRQLWTSICAGVPSFIMRIAPTIPAAIAADLCTSIARPWPVVNEAAVEHGLDM